MKVDKVIFSSDDSDYLRFWPHTAEITQKKLGILPVLFWITDEDSNFYFDDWGLVKKIKKSDKIPPSNQAQLYRMFGCKYFPNEVCMISDIDMFFYNKEYLERCLEGVGQEDWVIIGSDAYDPKRPECIFPYQGPDRYSMCYNISKGRNFENVLEIKGSFEGYIEKIKKFKDDWGLIDCDFGHFDEIYFANKINRQKNVNIHKIERGYRSSFWLPNHIYKKNFIESQTNKDEWLPYYLNLWGEWDTKFFIDCHCPGFSDYQDLILKIKNDILNEV